MIPEDCDQFPTCNASVCPLDDRWQKTVHLGGERVYLHLRNCVKTGADEIFANNAAYKLCKERLPLVVIHFPAIGRRLEIAAKSGFRGGHLRRPSIQRPEPDSRTEITVVK